MVCASISAYAAPLLMLICLLTNYWIYGKQTRSSQNPIIKGADIRIVNYTYYRIGFWKECTRELIDLSYICERVIYNTTDAKSEKGFKAVSCKICQVYFN